MFYGGYDYMNKYNVSKKINIFILITALLILAGIIVTIVFANRVPLIKTITLIIGYLLVLYYAFWGYKTPHGNVLRYLILAYAFLLALGSETRLFASARPERPVDVTDANRQVRSGARRFTSYKDLLTSISLVLMGYTAGRLNKYKQNKIIIPIVLVLLFVRSFVTGTTRIQVMMTDLSFFILWLGIACAYFARYDAHKEAGLLDKEDIK